MSGAWGITSYFTDEESSWKFYTLYVNANGAV